MKYWIKLTLPLAIFSSLLSGCLTFDAYTGESQVSNSSKGAIAGSIIGAVIGASTASKEDRAKQALIGAGIGGVAGGGIGYYMDRQEAILRKELIGSGIQVERTEEGQIELIMPGNITFEVGSATVQSSFTDTLTSLAKVLEEYDDTLITISGHTDSTGGSAYNQLLSEQRATSVANFLLREGVVIERIAAVGYGELYPIASNDNAAGRAENRRVEITLDAISAE
ncbi:OmpA family protein [Reinekea thalattae]|uniref:OmpA family protein n=1 Tax=Reinekea thalattae TaxID=2593301 RepID=UPI00164FFC0B|nr:OmpA family protein [Reinekea thalattae]